MKGNKGNTTAIVLIIIVIVVIAGWMFFGKSPNLDSSAISNASSTTVGEGSDVTGSFAKINGTTVNLFVAKTEDERELGLGGRASLPQDQAMLFVFDAPDTYEFWMKDMKFPLDIIWLDSNYKVVYIESSVAPETYPDTTFTPNNPSQYVIEANTGFVDKNHIKIGDIVEVSLKK